MTMPIHFFLVRHGESEGNLVKKRARAGDASDMTDAFRGRHSSRFRLTTRGIAQAQAAGAWLRDNGFARFDRYYVSEYVRAMETAGHLGLELGDGQRWYSDFFLRERDYGVFDVMPYEERAAKFAEYFHGAERDGFFWKPPGGESMADVAMRLGRLLDTLHRECSDKSVIAVCHGETMWAMRVRLERMSQERYGALSASKDPFDKIHNCQIIHYARRDPETRRLLPCYGWMRSICPWDETRSSNAWTRIERPTYSNEDLLALAASHPRLVDDA
ncbi:MAG TPA: phosphoglycerate mutase family protein [Patescibacteria group bacterium]|nr:phosphoglycerate mutase family protein [Patescibacteria group bacterium]